MLLDTDGIPVNFIAHDGTEAVELFKKANPKPDIILMDYRMPIMDGIEATKQILAIYHSTKIIFLSADIHVKDEALKAGAALFLKKPASINDIRRAIDHILNEDKHSGHPRPDLTNFKFRATGLQSVR